LRQRDGRASRAAGTPERQQQRRALLLLWLLLGEKPNGFGFWV